MDRAAQGVADRFIERTVLKSTDEAIQQTTEDVLAKFAEEVQQESLDQFTAQV